MSNENNPYDQGFSGGFSGGINYGASPQQADAPTQMQPGGGNAPEPVLDISTAQFMSEVIEYSRNKPVLVDFWAPWCGPCKQLTPALEAAVARAKGRVRLVKMNIDDHPEVAGQMGIQSIPAVVAFVDGQPKDAFMGAKSEREVEAFIEKIAGPAGPDPLQEALDQAGELMAQGNWDDAAGIYSQIIRQIPDNKDALAGYGMCALNAGKLEQARQALANAGEVEGHQGLEALRTALDLNDQAENLGDFSELEAAVASDPKNHQARMDLAVALNAANRREDAADHLLEIISKDKAWNDEAAKKQLLQFFEAWGMTDPNTLSARRRLSSLLFS